MSKELRHRRGTTVEHSAFTGAMGEWSYDTDKLCHVSHDGSTAGGTPVNGWVKLSPSGVLPVQTIASGVIVSGVDGDGQALCALGHAVVDGDLSGYRVAGRCFERSAIETLVYAAAVDSTCVYDTKTIALTGNFEWRFPGAYSWGARVRLRIVCDGTPRNLTFPAGWHFVGAARPASIAAGKVGLLELTAFGGTEAEVVASWLVES